MNLNDLSHCIICGAEEGSIHQKGCSTPMPEKCPSCDFYKWPGKKCKECELVTVVRSRVFDSAVTPTPSGALTSRAPRFDLLPRRALERVAMRFEKGLPRYGKDNWRKGLSDPEYVTDRIAHLIAHCYRLLDKIEGRLVDDEDDAGAIAWGGLFVCEAVDEQGRIGKWGDRADDLHQA